uniref:Uncharacterized protein n=1 Tax=Anguilla anguilla TaxID=7936 RepID=A0A0E9W4C6_ANGAN
MHGVVSMTRWHQRCLFLHKKQ